MFYEKGRLIVQVMSITFFFYFHKKPSQDNNAVRNTEKKVAKSLNSLSGSKNL